MDTSLFALLKDLYHLNFVLLVLVVGLYGYAIYGTIVITRLLHDAQAQNREVLRRLPDSR